MSDDSTPLSVTLSSPTESQLSLFSLVSASPITEQPANDRRGMKRDVYMAAQCGCSDCTDKLVLQNNWKYQKTPVGNNVLHIHVGKPVQIDRGLIAKNISIPFLKFSIHVHVPNPLKFHKNSVIVNISSSFIQYVLDETAHNSLLLQTNKNGDTPLHLAARFGQIDAVKEFLNREDVANDELLRKLNNNKDTALHDATRAGYIRIVKLLVEAGSENALQHMPNNLGETPLFLAAERGCSGLFCVILGHTDLAALRHRGPCGQTPLHAAVLCNNKDIVDQIMETDIASSLIRLQNELGQTPLHSCAARNVDKNCTILSILLNHDDDYDSVTYIQDNEGRTPLHLATLHHNYEGVEMLLDMYPDCMEVVDNDGRNVVHLAANTGCLNTFRRFLTRMTMCDRLINEKNNDGNTPLHLLAATTPTLPSHGCFFTLGTFIKLHNRLDVRAFNNNHLTPGDIIASNHSLRHFDAPYQTGNILPRGRRINNGVGKADRGERVESKATEGKKISELEKIEKRVGNLKKSGETPLVVAALIATVSFTAGFTVPGGFDQTPGKSIGLAVLVNKPAFIIFLIADVIAFTMSSLAIICYFIVSSQVSLMIVETLTLEARWLSTISQGALMVAFVTGVYAVVSHSPPLAFTVIAISVVYFYFYISLLIGGCKTLLSFITRTTRSRILE